MITQNSIRQVLVTVSFHSLLQSDSLVEVTPNTKGYGKVTQHTERVQEVNRRLRHPE